MPKGFFITGTDTGVGKTIVASALLQKINNLGLRTAGMKPVAAGCVQTTAGLRNDDADLLMENMSVSLPYEWVNPYAFEDPVAPHIAALTTSQVIDIKKIMDCYEQISAVSDCVIVEGAGGWKVPINDRESMADIAVALALPVIIVVSVKLGCLNHAILTYESLLKNEMPLAGWVANMVELNVSHIPEQIDTLRRTLYGPLLGIIPPMACTDPAQVAEYLDVHFLMGENIDDNH